MSDDAKNDCELPVIRDAVRLDKVLKKARRYGVVRFKDITENRRLRDDLINYSMVHRNFEVFTIGTDTSGHITSTLGTSVTRIIPVWIYVFDLDSLKVKKVKLK